MNYIIPKRNAKKIQQKLKEDKIVTDYDEEELQYLGTPIGKATFDHQEEDDEYTWTDATDSEDLEKIQKDNIDPDPFNGSNGSEDDDDEYTWTDATDSEDQEPETEFIMNSKPVKIERGKIKDKPDLAKTPKKKSHWSDRITCEVCGGEYTRSAVTAHKKTQKHKIYEKTNKNLLKIMRS